MPSKGQSKEAFVVDVSKAAKAVLTGKTDKAVRDGFERLICSVRTSCLGSTSDPSWGDGVSFEMMRCAIPTKMMQMMKARLHANSMWDRFADEYYLRLYHALYKDIMPSSGVLFDYDHESREECVGQNWNADGKEFAKEIARQEKANRSAAQKLRAKLIKDMDGASKP